MGIIYPRLLDERVKSQGKGRLAPQLCQLRSRGRSGRLAGQRGAIAPEERTLLS